jgi:hypothetical protein
MADEYCLFWIQWWATCLTKDAWAGWVQALGSLLALAIAIAIPLGMHVRERSLRAKEEEANALIVAVGVHAILGPLVGAARSVREDMQAYAPGSGMPRVELSIEKFDTVAFPNEWQILQIERVSRDAAIALARGAAITQQVKRAIGHYRGKRVADTERAHVAQLHGVLNEGVTQLERAQILLEPVMALEGMDVADAVAMLNRMSQQAGAGHP